MIAFLDTSAVLRLLLRQGTMGRGWARWDAAFASELLGLEARRTFDRLRLEEALNDDDVLSLREQLRAVEDSLGVVALTRAVVQRAALPMPAPVKALDAIHLVSALAVAERHEDDLRFVTWDAQQGRVAGLLGLSAARA